MATDDQQILVVGQATTPASWVVPGNGQVTPRTVFANYDGTSAAGAFFPALKVISDGGETVGIFPCATSVVAGGSADVTWFPGVTEPSVPAPSPNPLGTLYAWWDLADSTTVTLDGSGNIQLVKDKTGNGHDLSQGSAANRPGVTTVNSLDAMDCNYSTFTYVQGGPWSPTLAVPYTAFAVWTSTHALFTNYFPGATGNLDHQVGPGGWLMQHNDTGHIFVQTDGGSIVDSVVRAPFTQTLTGSIVDGASSSLRINGASQAGSLAGTTSLPDAVLGVAHVPDDTPFFSGLTGQVCEVLLYDGHLTASQIAATEAYLKAKWNTP